MAKLRLVKVHIFARDGVDCVYGEGEDKHIYRYDPDYMGPSCEGVVIYSVDPLSTEVGGPHYVMQHFGKSPTKNYSLDGVERGPIIWGWDGNMDAPSLTPSFRYFGGGGPIGKDWPMVHLYLTKGKIDLLGDSEAEL